MNTPFSLLSRTRKVLAPALLLAILGGCDMPAEPDAVPDPVALPPGNLTLVGDVTLLSAGYSAGAATPFDDVLGQPLPVRFSLSSPHETPWQDPRGPVLLIESPSARIDIGAPEGSYLREVYGTAISGRSLSLPLLVEGGSAWLYPFGQTAVAADGRYVSMTLTGRTRLGPEAIDAAGRPQLVDGLEISAAVAFSVIGRGEYASQRKEATGVLSLRYVVNP